MRLVAGDVVIWDPKPELALCLVAVVRDTGSAPEAIRDWSPEPRARVAAFARTTVLTTGGRVLVWSMNGTINLLGTDADIQRGNN